MGNYRLGIDVGGTFTDLLAFDGQSRELLRYKVPSEPQAPEEGVLAAIEALQRDHSDAQIEHIHHSTTLATNALLGQLHLTPATPGAPDHCWLPRCAGDRATGPLRGL